MTVSNKNWGELVKQDFKLKKKMVIKADMSFSSPLGFI